MTTEKKKSYKEFVSETLSRSTWTLDKVSTAIHYPNDDAKYYVRMSLVEPDEEDSLGNRSGGVMDLVFTGNTSAMFEPLPPETVDDILEVVDMYFETFGKRGAAERTIVMKTRVNDVHRQFAEFITGREYDYRKLFKYTSIRVDRDSVTFDYAR